MLLAGAIAACGAGQDAGRPPATHGDTVPPGVRAALPAGAVPEVCTATWGHADGDGFRCASGGIVRLVRIAAIDAPEIGQAHAMEARRRLAMLTPTGTVIACHGRDRHERHLCRVFDPSGGSVAATLLSEGLVWHAAHFAAEQTAAERALFARLMAEARAARRGLWAQPDPMPPWTCRDRQAQGEPCR